MKKKAKKKKSNLPQGRKRDGLTANQWSFINSFNRNNGNIPAVCRDIGIKEVTCYKYLNDIEVKKILAKNIDYCRSALQAVAPAIVAGLVEMFNNSSTPPAVKASIGNGLLDRAGLKEPTENTVNININTEISDRARQLLANRLQNSTDTIVDTTCKQVPTEDNTSKSKEIEDNLS